MKYQLLLQSIIKYTKKMGDETTSMEVSLLCSFMALSIDFDPAAAVFVPVA